MESILTRVVRMATSKMRHSCISLVGAACLLAGARPAAAQTFNPTGNMVVPFGGHAATLLNDGKVLLVGGNSSSISLASNAVAQLYDPATGTFTQLADMTHDRYTPRAVLLKDGKVLIAGGCSGIEWPYYYECAPVATAELYHPETGTFTPTGDMTTPRYLPTATLLNDGKVLIAGGCQGLGYDCAALDSAELYDPATGIFTPTGNMTTVRYIHTATLLNDGRVLLAGGETSVNAGDLASAELYIPASGTFAATGSMAGPGGSYRQAVLLKTGSVLITGGFNGPPGPIADAKLYDPATGTFTSAGSMTVPRYAHTATLLNNGEVLITGGGTNLGNTASAELYDPVNGTFTAVGSMSATRSYHTATLLLNGTVLIAGGYVPLAGVYWPPVSASAELYIMNQPPVAESGPDKDLIVHEVATFDGSGSSDSDGTIAYYHWDFGDGTTAEGEVVTHAYLTSGTFTASLTVIDNHGGTTTDTAIVDVHEVENAIISLLHMVTSYNLKQGIANSLDSKVQNILAAYSAANAGQRQDVANKMQAFINSVEAQRGKELTNAQADALVSWARRILSVL